MDCLHTYPYFMYFQCPICKYLERYNLDPQKVATIQAPTRRTRIASLARVRRRRRRHGLLLLQRGRSLRRDRVALAQDHGQARVRATNALCVSINERIRLIANVSGRVVPTERRAHAKSLSTLTLRRRRQRAAQARSMAGTKAQSRPSQRTRTATATVTGMGTHMVTVMRMDSTRRTATPIIRTRQ